MEPLIRPEKVLCPYDNSHVVNSLRLLNHMAKCPSRKKPNMYRCAFDFTHVMPLEDLKKHSEICEARQQFGGTTMEAFKFVKELKNQETTRECDQTVIWEDENYEPIEDAACASSQIVPRDKVNDWLTQDSDKPVETANETDFLRKGPCVERDVLSPKFLDHQTLPQVGPSKGQFIELQVAQELEDMRIKALVQCKRPIEYRPANTKIRGNVLNQNRPNKTDMHTTGGQSSAEADWSHEDFPEPSVSGSFDLSYQPSNSLGHRDFSCRPRGLRPLRAGLSPDGKPFNFAEGSSLSVSTRSIVSRIFKQAKSLDGREQVDNYNDLKEGQGMWFGDSVSETGVDEQNSDCFISPEEQNGNTYSVEKRSDIVSNASVGSGERPPHLNKHLLRYKEKARVKQSANAKNGCNSASSSVITEQRNENTESSSVITGQRKGNTESSSVITEQQNGNTAGADEKSDIVPNISVGSGVRSIHLNKHLLRYKERARIKQSANAKNGCNSASSSVITEQRNGNTESSSVITGQRKGNTESSSVITEQQNGNTAGGGEKSDIVPNISVGSGVRPIHLNKHLLRYKERARIKQSANAKNGSNSESSSVISEQLNGNTESSSVITEQRNGNTDSSSVITKQQNGNTDSSPLITELQKGNTVGADEKSDIGSNISVGSGVRPPHLNKHLLRYKEKARLKKSANAENGCNSESSSVITEQRNGNTESSSVITEQQHGNTESSSVITEQQNGNTDSISLITEQQKGNTAGADENSDIGSNISVVSGVRPGHLNKHLLRYKERARIKQSAIAESRRNVVESMACQSSGRAINSASEYENSRLRGTHSSDVTVFKNEKPSFAEDSDKSKGMTISMSEEAETTIKTHENGSNVSSEDEDDWYSAVGSRV